MLAHVLVGEPDSTSPGHALEFHGSLQTEDEGVVAADVDRTPTIHRSGANLARHVRRGSVTCLTAAQDDLFCADRAAQKRGHSGAIHLGRSEVAHFSTPGYRQKSERIVRTFPLCLNTSGLSFGSFPMTWEHGV
jgi:hypothetical protein